MGAHRDEQLFREMDASQYGRSEGRRSGEFVTTALIAQTLGVDREQVAGLRSRDVAERLTGLMAVAAAIEERVAVEQDRHFMYTSTDPANVAKIMVDEQTDFEADNNGLHDSLFYRFKIDDEGLCKVESELLPNFGFEEDDVNGDWVMKRLEVLGVGQDAQFCANVAEQISSILSQTTE